MSGQLMLNGNIKVFFSGFLVAIFQIFLFLYPNTEISLTEWEQEEVWKEACERDIHQ
jgi:hypothetical protein